MYLFVRNVLQPFPNALAIASSQGYGIAIVIALGFLANTFQVICNSFIGMAKIIVIRDVLSSILRAAVDVEYLIKTRWKDYGCHWTIVPESDH